MARTFVMGDIHGGFKALKQCLKRSNFDYENDILIHLGDVADGWDEVYECVEELLSIKNLISIKGNHDDWFLEYLLTGIHPAKWLQGGHGTAKSYLRYLDKEDKLIPKMSGFIVSMKPDEISINHINFFKNQLPYYIHNKKLFIHGGFNRHFLLEEQDETIFWWDRDLWLAALSHEAMTRNEINKNIKFKMKNDFEEIFIGHTTTLNWGKEIPMKAANVYNLDTGGGFMGKLTIMDIETKEYWQSDNVNELYPNQKSR